MISYLLWLIPVFLITGSDVWAQEGSVSAPMHQGGSSKAFNPDIGVNGLFLYRNGNRGNDRNVSNPNGFGFQEGEFQFMSDVDPYMKATVLFSVEKEAGAYKISPEETFLDSLALQGVNLRVGKFKSVIVKQNTLHTHAFPFIDQSLPLIELLGDEGLNEMGVSASYLLPTNFYSDLTVQGLQGENDTMFKGPNPTSGIIVVRTDNLFDIDDSTTLEAALSGANGKNASDKDSNILGGDLIVKWRPTILGTYHAIIFANQFLAAQKGNNPDDEFSKGLTSYLQYQVHQGWWLQARTEYFQKLAGTSETTIKRKSSALVGYFPSEFSGFRLQYDHIRDASQTAEQRLMFQMNFSIGAHPAHAY